MRFYERYAACKVTGLSAAHGEQVVRFSATSVVVWRQLFHDKQISTAMTATTKTPVLTLLASGLSVCGSGRNDSNRDGCRSTDWEVLVTW
jgi:hypothetical protein